MAKGNAHRGPQHHNSKTRPPKAQHSQAHRFFNKPHYDKPPQAAHLGPIDFSNEFAAVLAINSLALRRFNF